MCPPLSSSAAGQKRERAPRPSSTTAERSKEGRRATDIYSIDTALDDTATQIELTHGIPTTFEILAIWNGFSFT